MPGAYREGERIRLDAVYSHHDVSGGSRRTDLDDDFVQQRVLRIVAAAPNLVLDGRDPADGHRRTALCRSEVLAVDGDVDAVAVLTAGARASDDVSEQEDRCLGLCNCQPCHKQKPHDREDSEKYPHTLIPSV